MKHVNLLRYILASVAVAATLGSAKAQSAINTPYSLFGIGSLYSNTNQLGMAIGGSSSAFSSPYFINPLNPASYMALDSNSFVFDGGFILRNSTLKTVSQSQTGTTGSIANVNFGFPVTKWWRASLGVRPFSSAGYEIASEQQIENVGNVLFSYTGSGGLNKAYIGHAFRPFKNFSAGVNVEYVFGNIDRQSTATFPDSGAFKNSLSLSAARFHKLNYNFGLLYRIPLSSGNFAQAGITFAPSQTLSGKADMLAYTFTRDYSSNLDTPDDTLYYKPGADGEVTMPLSVGAGIMVGNTNRWMGTADVNWQKWSQFTYLGKPGQLQDNLRLSLGGQFRPSPLDMGKYWQRVHYRAGVRYEQSYLEVHDTRLSDFGISFGLGLPMKKSRSTINLAVEAGTQGSTVNGLIRENYIRFSLGAALQERWFIKRRYN